MKVAHIITRMILGGAQENTLLNCEDLLRHYGDDVLLITGPALGPEGSLLERARQRGVKVELIPELRRAIHPWFDAVSYVKLKRVLRSFDPQVVHTHSAKAGLLGRAAATALNVPVVVHGVHGAPFHLYQSAVAREFFRRCERWAARRCHAMISVADAMTELLVSAGVAPREKFTTVYSGMEVEPFLQSGEHRQRARRELGFADDEVVVGKVARLFHLKGHADVVRAARQVVDNAPEARFLFVGDGILRAPLEQSIAAAGLGHYFTFTGLVPPERVPELMAAMDVVVHASLREGLARALPQALIAGKPVVSYDIDGAREVVVTDETGFLVPPQDVTALAEAIQRLVRDDTLRNRLGQEGRKRCTEVFRHEYMTARIREVYERLLAHEGVIGVLSHQRPTAL